VQVYKWRNVRSIIGHVLCTIISNYQKRNHHCRSGYVHNKNNRQRPDSVFGGKGARYHIYENTNMYVRGHNTESGLSTDFCKKFPKKGWFEQIYDKICKNRADLSKNFHPYFRRFESHVLNTVDAGMNLAFKIWRGVLDLRGCLGLHTKSTKTAKLCMNLTKSRHFSLFFGGAPPPPGDPCLRTTTWW